MASSAHAGNLPAPHRPAVADRLIRITTALAVAAVAAVAAVISYRHAYELVITHGETGLTARLLPFTVDGLILAASMLILDASRRHHPEPPLARWCLGAGIAAIVGANLAHGLGHGPIGALVSAWPALALAHDPHPNRPIPSRPISGGGGLAASRRWLRGGGRGGMPPVRRAVGPSAGRAGAWRSVARRAGARLEKGRPGR
jgi:Protein of unknown function (DUF2637)